MAYGLIDDQLHGHPKALAAGLEAMGLWTMALSWCRCHKTNGLISLPAVERIAGAKAKKLSQRLVDVGLWEVDGSLWRFHDWKDRYREKTSEEANELSNKRREAGKKGAKATWGDGKPDGKFATNIDGNQDGKKWHPGPSPSPSPSPKELQTENKIARALREATGVIQGDCSVTTQLCLAIEAYAKETNQNAVALVPRIVEEFRAEAAQWESPKPATNVLIWRHWDKIQARLAGHSAPKTAPKSSGFADPAPPATENRRVKL